MFVREKRINGYSYLYLVESVREDGRAKQRIIKNLGRKEVVVGSGELERLAASVARYAERGIVLSQLETGNPESLACKRIGAPLLFVFLAVGMLAGEAGQGGITFDDVRTTYIVGSVALALILFDGGLRTRFAASTPSPAWSSTGRSTALPAWPPGTLTSSAPGSGNS